MSNSGSYVDMTIFLNIVNATAIAAPSHFEVKIPHGAKSVQISGVSSTCEQNIFIFCKNLTNLNTEYACVNVDHLRPASIELLTSVFPRDMLKSKESGIAMIPVMQSLPAGSYYDKHIESNAVGLSFAKTSSEIYVSFKSLPKIYAITKLLATQMVPAVPGSRPERRKAAKWIFYGKLAKAMNDLQEAGEQTPKRYFPGDEGEEEGEDGGEGGHEFTSVKGQNWRRLLKLAFDTSNYEEVPRGQVEKLTTLLEAYSAVKSPRVLKCSAVVVFYNPEYRQITSSDYEEEYGSKTSQNSIILRWTT